MTRLLLAPFRFVAAMARVLSDWWRRRRIFASEEVAEARRSLCHGCPQRHGILCSACCCVVDLKTSLRREVCPLGKW